MNSILRKKLNEFFEYLLTYLVIGFSSAGYWTEQEYLLTVITVFLFVVCILKDKFFFTKKYAAFFLILVFVIIMQGLTTDIFDTRSIS